jgi:hypothetical protein
MAVTGKDSKRVSEVIINLVKQETENSSEYIGPPGNLSFFGKCEKFQFPGPGQKEQFRV